MSLTLYWKNDNVVPVINNIYRGDEELDRDNLSDPIGTVTDGSNQFTDTSAIQGYTYFYVIETVATDDSDRTSTQNMEITVATRLGVGSNVFIYGDTEYGYYDKIPSGKFIETNDLISQLGISDLDGVTYQDGLYWYKWSRNGETLFVPQIPIGLNISWIQLYNAGIVFGTNDNGKGSFLPAELVNQYRTVTLNNDKYIVRLMTGYDDNGVVPPDNSAGTDPVWVPQEVYPCEYNDLILPLWTGTPEQQRQVNIEDNIPELLGHIADNFRELCQEQASSTVAVSRGSDMTDPATDPFARAYMDARKCVMISPGDNGELKSVWRPVLQLVK